MVNDGYIREDKQLNNKDKMFTFLGQISTEDYRDNNKYICREKRSVIEFYKVCVCGSVRNTLAKEKL